jgi:exosortase E/protease (VPEID-CTERM system)
MPLQLALTALLFGVELLAITMLVDAQFLIHAGGLAGFAGLVGPWGLKGLLLAAVLTAVFGLLTPNLPDRRPTDVSRWFLSKSWLGVHVLATLAFDLCAYLLCSPKPPLPADWLAVATVAAGLLSMASGLLVFLPFAFWHTLVAAAPWAPVYGIITAFVSVLIVATSRPIAEVWRGYAYNVVSGVLQHFSPEFHCDRPNFVIGARNFRIEIAPQCSGYEGVALMLAFGVMWLLIFRRDFRFPHALLLLPLGMAAIWILNCVRLILLILIGVWGAPGIAMGGFHSQAGWIAFVTLAVSSAIVWQRVPWALAHPAVRVRDENHTAPYLLPFLAILGAGMIAQAFSDGLEWLYPLRVVAAVCVLWAYRRSYRELPWRPHWDALWLGTLVVLIWIGADFAWGTHLRAPMPTALAAAPRLWRTGWIVSRVLGAVLTVPIAEELAFRGFLLRRLVSADFVRVDFRVWTPLALVGSSAAFALMHGNRWPAALAAGLIYAWAMHRSGSLGTAVTAHATSNLLLAGVVLITGDWSYW